MIFKHSLQLAWYTIYRLLYLLNYQIFNVTNQLILYFLDLFCRVHRYAPIKYAPCGSTSAYQCRHNDAVAAAAYAAAPFSVKTFKPTKADLKRTHTSASKWHTPCIRYFYWKKRTAVMVKVSPLLRFLA